MILKSTTNGNPSHFIGYPCWPWLTILFRNKTDLLIPFISIINMSKLRFPCVCSFSIIPRFVMEFAQFLKYTLEIKRKVFRIAFRSSLRNLEILNDFKTCHFCHFIAGFIFGWNPSLLRQNPIFYNQDFQRILTQKNIFAGPVFLENFNFITNIRLYIKHDGMFVFAFCAQTVTNIFATEIKHKVL